MYISNAEGLFNHIPQIGTETSSIHSPYIPYYAIVNPCTNIIKTADNIYIYSFINTDVSISHLSINYAELRRTLNGYVNILRRFSNKSNSINIVVGKGIIIEKSTSKILYILVNSTFNKNIDRIFISSELLYKEEYKSLYKWLSINILIPAIKEEVKIEIAPAQEIFKSIFIPVVESVNSYPTIGDFEKYLKKGVIQELYKEDVLLEKEEENTIEQENTPPERVVVHRNRTNECAFTIIDDISEIVNTVYNSEEEIVEEEAVF